MLIPNQALKSVKTQDDKKMKSGWREPQTYNINRLIIFNPTNVELKQSADAYTKPGTKKLAVVYTIADTLLSNSL